MPGTALRGEDRAMNTTCVTEPLPPKALSPKVLLQLVNTKKLRFQFIPDSLTHSVQNTTRTMKTTQSIFIQVSNTSNGNLYNMSKYSNTIGKSNE